MTKEELKTHIESKYQQLRDALGNRLLAIDLVEDGDDAFKLTIDVRFPEGDSRVGTFIMFNETEDAVDSAIEALLANALDPGSLRRHLEAADKYAKEVNQLRKNLIGNLDVSKLISALRKANLTDPQIAKLLELGQTDKTVADKLKKALAGQKVDFSVHLSQQNKPKNYKH